MLGRINFKNLKKLSILRLQGLKLKKIPKILFELSELESIDLLNNEISEIQIDLLQKSSIKTLKINPNQLKIFDNKTLEILKKYIKT